MVTGASTKAFVHQFSSTCGQRPLQAPVRRVPCVEPGPELLFLFLPPWFHGDQAKADAVSAGTRPAAHPDYLPRRCTGRPRCPDRQHQRVIEMMATVQLFAAVSDIQRATRPSSARVQ